MQSIAWGFWRKLLLIKFSVCTINGLRKLRLQKLGNLSAGNQYTIVIGKWLSTNLQVLILDESTRIIGVGSKAETHRLI
jgi:ABC-type sugar transport system ATPase subunit